MVFECVICRLSLESATSNDSEDSNLNSNSSKPNQNSETPPKIVVTTCGHIFHKECIEAWFKDKWILTCPFCRSLCKGKTQQVFPIMATENVENIPETESSFQTSDNQEGLDYNELKKIHETLINDYSELEDKYWNSAQSADIKQAQMESYAEANKKLQEENQKLKESIDILTKNGNTLGGEHSIHYPEQSFEQSKRKLSEESLEHSSDQEVPKRLRGDDEDQDVDQDLDGFDKFD